MSTREPRGRRQGTGHERPLRRVGDTLDHVLAGLGGPRSSVIEAVFARWPELVGQGLATRAYPARLRDGVLVVEVTEPGWASQVRWLEADLLRRLAAEVGEGVVTGVEVRVRRPPRRG